MCFRIFSYWDARADNNDLVSHTEAALLVLVTVVKLYEYTIGGYFRECLCPKREIKLLNMLRCLCPFNSVNNFIESHERHGYR